MKKNNFKNETKIKSHYYWFEGMIWAWFALMNFFLNLCIEIIFHGDEKFYLAYIIIHLFLAMLFIVFVDMYQVLKRLGVRSYSFKRREKIYLELYYIYIYYSSLYDSTGMKFNKDRYEYAFSRKKYTNEFYEKHQKYVLKYRHTWKNQSKFSTMDRTETSHLVSSKMERANSKSFIMKNNLPKNVTEKDICQVYREKGTDIIFHGTIFVINVIFYTWYFLIN